MSGMDKSAVAAARYAANGAAGSGGGTLSAIGLGGLAIEWKHGLAAILNPFLGCGSVGEGIARLSRLDDATFLGIGLYIAIMVASTITLALGIRRMLRRRLPSPVRLERTPPGEAQEKDY
jgi:hypothetical protein